MTAWPRALRFVAAGTLVAATLAGCAASRPPAAPADHIVWGSLHLDHGHEARSLVTREILEGMLEPDLLATLPRDPDGAYVYPVLSLSGGGSYVAFAAGLLTGWSEYGDRPQFRVVTAMSGGALVAPWAFLGSDYDRLLEEMFTTIETENVYRTGPLGFLGALFGAGAFDFAPGRSLIERYVTPDVVDAIAAEHRRGRRLYLATANMDDNVTTLWDIGEIAAGDRPDRVDHIRRIIAASVAVPGLFPPIYFDVEIDGQRYGQMHMDAQIDFVLLRDFMMAADATAAERQGLDGLPRARIYAIMSTKPTPHYDVPPQAWGPELGRRALERIGRYASYGALDRLYLFALAHDAELRVAHLPVEYDPGMPNFAFERAGLTRLYRYGFEQARRGYAWSDAPPELPPEERIRRRRADVSRRPRRLKVETPLAAARHLRSCTTCGSRRSGPGRCRAVRRGRRAPPCRARARAPEPR
jgi:hypothetical protein